MNILKITTCFISFAIFAAFIMLALPASIHAYFTSSATLSNLSIGFGDWTPPATTLTQLPQLITPAEHVINGTFEDGLNGWTTTGIVSITHHKGMLGTTQSFGTHSVSQTLIGKGVLFVTYAVMGNETPLLPVFSIVVNGNPMVQSIQTDGYTRTAIIPLTQEVNIITIAVESNPLLTTTPVWAEISEVTTAKLAVGLQNTIQLASDEIHATQWFEFSSSLPQQYASPFSLSDQNEIGSFHYWSTDDLDNKELPQRIAYVQEKNVPEIGDVFVEILDQEFKTLILPTPPSTCPISYFTQPAGLPLSLSSLPYLDRKSRVFLANTSSLSFSPNNTLSLIAKSCFQTSSEPKEIVIP